MKRIYILALTAMLGLGFSSCSRELDMEKLGNMGAEKDFYKTDDDSNAAITACYTQMGTLFESVKNIDDLLSDDLWCGGGQRNDNAQCEDIGSYIFGTNNGMLQTMYEDLYTLIYDANLVIEKFENTDSQTKRRNLAEAYFFRGFAHFYLGAFYGTAPVVDHLLSKDEYQQPNGTRSQLYGQAVSDLRAAVESGSLESKSNLNDRTVRVTLEAAEAMLGKVYVFAEEYREAASQLGKVINSGLYQLSSANYEDLLHAKNDYDPEFVLFWNSVSDPDNLNFSVYYFYRGFRSEFYDWNASDPDLAFAFGFFNPTKDLYDAFVAEEGADGYRLNQTIKTMEQVNGYGISIIPGRILHGHEGYWNWKQRLLNSDFLLLGLFPVVNFPWMRFAEVLLLAAEANLQSGNTAEALRCINLVRQRAQLPEKNAVTMDDIKTEKRLELWGEGTRWMDLVRWGDAASRLSGKGKEMPGFDGTKTVVEYTQAGAGYVSGKHEMLPIPAQEIKLNDNMQQNPGY